MIADADRAIFTFRDVSAVVTNNSSGVSFLIDEDSDSLPLSEIFLDTLERQLGKMRSKLLGHVHQEDGLLSAFDVVVETFVIHISYVVKYKKDANLNRKEFLNHFHERLIFDDGADVLLELLGSRDSFDVLEQMFPKFCERDSLWMLYIHVHAIRHR